jgi:serine/threonine-protein kinase
MPTLAHRYEDLRIPTRGRIIMRRLLILAACMAGVAGGHAADAAKPAYDLALVDMQGNRKVIAGLSAAAFSPRVSPDGREVAFESEDEIKSEVFGVTTRIYVLSMDKPDKRRQLQISVTAPKNISPEWSPNGQRIALTSTGNAADQLFWERADGGIQPIYLVDGRFVDGIYGTSRVVFTWQKGQDLGISEYNTDTRKASKLVDAAGTAQYASRISPDGKWIAYTSNETGRAEVWLEPLPANGKRYQLTKNGGAHPQFSPDGTKVFYDQGGQLYRLDLAIAAEPKAADPVALPIKGFVQTDMRRQYDLTPDGKGFVMLFPAAAR